MTIHAGTTIDMYRSIPYYLDGGRVCVLGAVKWEIYQYTSMGTIMNMMLLFTRQVYAVRECGQSRHRFQKCPFWSVYTET